MANSASGILDAIIRVSVQGAQESLGEINKLSGGNLKALAGLGIAVQGLSTAYQLLSGIAKQTFDVLIRSNEELNANILRQQTFIAQGTRLFGASGKEITDISAKIDATRGKLKEALIGVQKDTQDLVGVTTGDVNEAFGIVVQQAGKLSGQFSEAIGGDVIEASRKLTKSVVASIGTLKLPMEQVRQEFNALINGDLNNADAVLAKTLNIQKSEFDKAKSQGRLVDFLVDKMKAFEIANAKASRSIDGISSNIQSFFEDLARVAGEPLLEPIVNQLDLLQKALFASQDKIQSFAAGLSKKIAPELDKLLSSLGKVAGLLMDFGKFVAELLGLQEADQYIKLIADGFDGLALSIGAIKDISYALGDVLESVFGQGSEVASGFNEKLGPILGTLIELQEQAGIVGSEIARLSGQGDEFEVVKSMQELNEQTADYGIKANAIFKQIAELKAKTQDKGATQEQEKQLAILNAKASIYVSGLEAAGKEIGSQRLFSKEAKELNANQLEANKARLKGIEENTAALAKQYKLKPEQITIKAKLLDDKGAFVKGLSDDISSKLKTLKDGASGDRATFDKTAQEAISLIQQANELGIQKVDKTISQLEFIRNDTKQTREIRLAASKALTQTLEQDSQRRIAIVKAESSAIEASIATGKISAEQGASNKLRIEAKQTQLEVELAKKKLSEAKSFGDKKGQQDAELQLKELSNKLSGLGGQIATSAYQEQNAKLSKFLEIAEGKLQKFRAGQSLEIAKNVKSQQLTNEAEAEAQAKLSIDIANKELAIAKQKADSIAKLPKPASQAETFAREKALNDARIAQLSATESVIAAEGRLEQARLASGLAGFEQEKLRNEVRLSATRTILAKLEATESQSAESIKAQRDKLESSSLQVARDVAAKKLALISERQGPRNEKAILQAKQELEQAEQAQAGFAKRQLDEQRQLANKRIELDSSANTAIIAGRKQLLEKAIASEKDIATASIPVERLRIQQAETDNRKKALEAQYQLANSEQDSIEKKQKLFGLQSQISDATSEQIKLEHELGDAIVQESIENREFDIQLLEKATQLAQQGFDAQLKQLSLAEQALQRQQALLRARADLLSIQTDFSIASLTRANELLADSISLQESLGKAGEKEAEAIREILNARGEAEKLTESSLDRQKELQLQIAKAEYDKQKEALESRAKLLELEQKQAEVSLKRGEIEAQQGLLSLKLERAKLDVELAKAALAPPEVRDALTKALGETIKLQDQAVQFGEQALQNAKDQAKEQAEINKLKAIGDQIGLKQAKDENESKFARSKDSIKLNDAKARDKLSSSTSRKSQSPLDKENMPSKLPKDNLPLQSSDPYEASRLKLRQEMDAERRELSARNPSSFENTYGDNKTEQQTQVTNIRNEYNFASAAGARSSLRAEGF